MHTSISGTEQDVESIDFTGAKIINAKISNYHYGCILDTNNITFRELRKYIFLGIKTPVLLSGLFSTITDEPGDCSLFEQFELVAWMCGSVYKYKDGQYITLYIKNSSINDVMSDIFKAFKGDSWSERVFKFIATLRIQLNDNREVLIEV
jgi:hypothetical protein